MRKRCKQGTCTWVTIRGSTVKQRCAVCGDRFPCTKLCLHYECVEARIALAAAVEPQQETAV
jgi:hypothetical protein